MPIAYFMELISQQASVLRYLSQYVIVYIVKMLDNYNESRTKYESCSVIVAGSAARGALLIGDFNSATDSSLLTLHNVKTVITAAAGMKHLQIPQEVTHVVYPLLDSRSQNIKRLFAESTATIQSNLSRGGVLVHCMAGISRSTTLVAAYLIATRKITFRDAMALIRLRRANVCPNLGFERQLKKYEKEVLDSNSHKRIIAKKTVCQKLGEERRSSCHSYFMDHKIKGSIEYFQLHPRTAEQRLRKRAQMSRRSLAYYSKSQASGSRKKKVVTAGSIQDLMVFGHASRQIIRSNNQIKCSAIKHHLPSVLKAARVNIKKQAINC